MKGMQHIKVKIEDQGLRDGLQSLSKTVPTALKLEILSDLVSAGLKRIEIASFVHPKMVPTMADAEAVCKGITHDSDVLFTSLALNFRGLQRAEACGMTNVTSILYGTETFALKNSGKSIAENKLVLKEMLSHCRQSGTKLRGGISVAFGCRYEGAVNPQKIKDLTKYLLDEGVSELYLADTTGMGNPSSVGDLSAEVIALAGDVPVGLHLHDTESKGYANLVAGLNNGIRIFDTSFGGLGGCPFVKGASGNIATEDTVNLLQQMGYETGIDAAKVAIASMKMSQFLDIKLPGKFYDLVSRDDIKFI